MLAVAVPCLLIQPLVENAVRHGLENKEGVGHVTISAQDGDVECILSVEDDGMGMDPEIVRDQLAGRRDHGVGLVNVDERLRAGVRCRPRDHGRDRPGSRHQDHRAEYRSTEPGSAHRDRFDVELLT